MAKINFNKAEYLTAAHYSHQWPKDLGAEVAFAGRSNVGKSSAINAITNRRGLAKTSKTPGRTQQIVFFSLADNLPDNVPDNVPGDLRLVDLPGYGYAKAPQELRLHWQAFLADYLVNRQCLKALIIPMDIRRPLTDLDVTMLDCCRDTGLSVHILLTKADKFKRGKASNIFHAVVNELQDEPQISVQLFSAKSRVGVDQAKAVITSFLTDLSPQLR